MAAARHRRDARRVNKKGETWDVTVARVHNQYPSTRDLDWHEALRDYDLMGRLMRGILQADARDLGLTQVRRGSLPPLDFAEGMRRLREMRGDDYTMMPFHHAFTVLAHGRSRRSVANSTGISYPMIQRLITGAIPPSGADMERIAVAFKKRPEFFREYRAAVLCALVARLLEGDPERSATMIHHLRGNLEGTG